jgi:hypothetical protein
MVHIKILDFLQYLFGLLVISFVLCSIILIPVSLFASVIYLTLAGIVWICREVLNKLNTKK